MIKKVIFLFLFGVLLYSCGKTKNENLTSSTSKPIITSALMKINIDGGVTLIDTEGKIRFELLKLRTGQYSEGRLRYQDEDNRKWGYLDSAGQKIIPAQFEKARDFSEGLARVKYNEKWGYIDYAGNRVIASQFDEARSFKGGFAQVQKVEGGEEEEEEENPEEDGEEPHKGLWGYINTNGKRVIDYQFTAAGPFSEGLAAVLKDGKVGFINPLGKYVIEPHFAASTDKFQNGYCLVTLNPFPNPSWAFIDKSGKIISQFVYDQVHPPSEGLARVQVKKKWGFIDIHNNPVIPISFDWAVDFKEGLAPVRVDSAWGYIDMSGKMAIAPRFYIAENFQNGIAYTTVKNGWGIIDKQGNYIFERKITH